MKISSRERNLLLLLFIAVGGYLFYTFIYTPQFEKLESLKQEKQAKQDQYNQMQALINSEGNIDLEIETIKNELLPIADTYFGDINQEETIVLLDDFAQKAGLDVKGIKFVEPIEKSLTELKEGESSKPGQTPPTATESTPPTATESTPPAATESTPPDTEGEDSKELVRPDNIIARVGEVAFEGSYDKLMNYLIQVGNYYKRIASYSLELKAEQGKPLAGTIFMNLYCINSVDKYVPVSPSVLEYNLIPLSSKVDPFEIYSWSYKITTIPNAIKSQVGQKEIIGPVEQGMYNLPEQTKEDPITMHKTIELGAQNPPPSAPRLLDEKLIYSFDDIVLKTFTLDKGNNITGKLDTNKDSKNKLYTIYYSFGGEQAQSEVYIDLQSKKITIDKQPIYLSLLVNTEKNLDNILGIIVTDANGSDFKVFMSSKVDWTNDKEIIGVLPQNIAFPVTVKSLFVRDNSDSATKNAKLSFDELKAVYKID